MKQRRLGQIATSAFLIVISMLMPACGSLLGDGATATIDQPYGASMPTLTPYPMAKPQKQVVEGDSGQPAPASRPTAAMIVETPAAFQPITTALEKIAQGICQSAKPAQKTIASLPKRTLPEASILAFSSRDWEPGNMWKSFSLPFVSAVNADDVRYPICIQVTRT